MLRTIKKAARMLSLTIGEIPCIVSARLSRSVTFKKHGIWYTIDPDTTIQVDVDTQIGLINGRHVQLDVTDYQVVGMT